MEKEDEIFNLSEINESVGNDEYDIFLGENIEEFLLRGDEDEFIIYWEDDVCENLELNVFFIGQEFEKLNEIEDEKDEGGIELLMEGMFGSVDYEIIISLRDDDMIKLDDDNVDLFKDFDLSDMLIVDKGDKRDDN